MRKHRPAPRETGCSMDKFASAIAGALVCFVIPHLTQFGIRIIQFLRSSCRNAVQRGNSIRRF
jgi:hypothetical protein